MAIIRRFRDLALFAFFLGAGIASAEYRFDVWKTESGLPNNTVNTIVPSRQGYLWVGTQDGLARFDGVRFTVFNKVNFPGLVSNHIFALYEDRDGDLWIGTREGGVIRYHHGSFTSVGPPDKWILGITGDQRGNLWVTTDNSLQRVQGSSFVPDLPQTAAFQSGRRGWNASGLFWAIGQDSLELYLRGKLTTLYLTNGLPSLQINKIDEDQHGTLWLATDDAGLVKVQDGKITKVYTERDGLPSNRVTGWYKQTLVCEDQKGNIWVNGAGPWLGRLKDGVFHTYPSTNTLSSQPLPTPGSPGSGITVLLDDAEGNLWIGTDSGLIRAREQVVSVLSTHQGLQDINIYPVCQDQSGAVWLGAWNNGLIRVEADRVTNFPQDERHRLATAMCADRQGRLWVGTYGGVMIFENGAPTYAGVPLALSNEVVSAILQDRAGAMWFGCEQGLFRYDNRGLSHFTTRDGLPGQLVSVLMEDRSGALWIGTRSGLARLSEGRFTTWTEAEGLPSNHLLALYEDAEGTLWIGTSDAGLGRFKNGRFTRYTTQEGMFDNGVFQILEDGAGNFWMSSNRGIHRVRKQELNEFAEGRRRSITSIAYGKSDGMLNAECNGGRWPAGIKTREGKLWFPTQDGVAVIDPASVPTNLKPPPVVIEAVLVDHQPQALEQPLRVPPGKAAIEIQYTGLSFVNSDRLSFKYRLAPADDDWVEAGTRRTAYYRHLGPGRYAFSVLAANSDGVWSQMGASLAFTVLPAWYQTWWARGLGGVGLASIFFTVYRLRINRLQRARAAEQEFSRRLMESQEQERQRLAAELHDSVGQSLLVIKNRAVMAIEHSANPGKISEQITEVSNIASQALREVRGMAQDLRPFQLDEMGLTKAILAMTRRLADSSNIQFHADISELNGELPKEREIHFYRIVQELLTNIVKHSKATEANLTIRKAGPILRALIQDNGCGFNANGPAGEPLPQAGFGLRGIRERVRTLGGRLQLDSRPGEGAMAVVEVPIEIRE